MEEDEVMKEKEPTQEEVFEDIKDTWREEGDNG